jgi:hypothetical protein
MPDLELADPLAMPVVRTFERHAFDTEQFIADDESTLALFGLREACFASAIVDPSHFEAILVTGKTPGGLPVVEAAAELGQQRVISPGSPEAGILPLDLTTFTHPGKGVRFAMHRRRAERLNPRSPLGALRTVKPSYVLNRITPTRTKQHQRDAALINGYYDRRIGVAIAST